MVKDPKEEILVKELFDTIADNEELDKNVFKNTIYSILRINTEEHIKTTAADISKRFETFYLNKMLSTASRSRKQATSQTLIKTTTQSTIKQKEKLQSENTIGHEKCLSLYNLSKIVKKQSDRTNEEVEYERAKSELTFVPKVHK